MSAAAIFYSQFAGAQPSARVSSFAQRLVRVLDAIGFMLVGAYPEPRARRTIAVRRRSGPDQEARS